MSDITGPWTLLPVRPISCFPWLALDPENILFLGQKPAEEFAHLIHQTHLKIAAPEALPLLWETDLPTELTARAELRSRLGWDHWRGTDPEADQESLNQVKAKPLDASTLWSISIHARPAAASSIRKSKPGRRIEIRGHGGPWARRCGPASHTRSSPAFRATTTARASR